MTLQLYGFLSFYYRVYLKKFRTPQGTYKAIFVMHILQGLMTFVSECAGDSFVFAITMHLCGQLELLRINFVEVGRKIAGRNHYQNFLGPWIRRHHELIILARNIEDIFNLNLLIRLSIITVFIAISGIHLKS